MAYDRYYTGGWQDGESGATPITAAALNHIEGGIVDVSGSSYALYMDNNTTAIQSGEDIDSYKTEGVYVVPTAAIAQSLSNYPTTVGGRLEVYNILAHATGAPDSAKRLYQRLYASGANCATFYRYWNGTTWGAWYRVTMTEA